MTFGQKMATNERTSRPAGHEISENFKFLMSFAMGCSYYWAGQHEPSSFSPQHRKHRSFSFFCLLWSWWMIGRQGRPVDSTRRMEAFGTSRNVESFYLGAGLTTCWIMDWAKETTRQSQVRLRRSGYKLCSESFWQNELGHDAFSQS